jgi:KRAB domain-containing zinc finger protein
MVGCSAGNKQGRQFERKSSDSEKLTLLLQENNKWMCVICGLNFHLKIDVIQHIKMKHKGMSTVSSSFVSEIFSVTADHLTSFQDTSIKDHQISCSPISSPVLSGKVIRRKKEQKKQKVKETTELLIISSKMDSIEPEPFQAPIGESESMRQILSVKWHCKLCPNWYRLRKCCLQHVQKEHNVRGNWARFYFHNSQQVTSHPSMEICTGPHVDVNAFSFCIVCGRSYNDYNEILRHMRRNHGYIQEVHRSRCVLNKLEGIKIIVACDIFMDLHVYTVGKGSAKLVDKEFLSELFENGIDGKGDFKESDVAAAMKLKRILYENGMINLNQLELDKLKDTDHNFDVYTISFKEDFQWERSRKTTVSDSDIVMTDLIDTDDNKEVQNDLVTTDVISLMRCHKCNLSFPDRISLDEHNLIHKVQVKFTCRLCNKNFPKLFFLLQHLEIKHNQTHKNYFQFVLEHEQLVGGESDVEDGQNDTKAENLEPLDDKIADIKHSEDNHEELEEEDVETTETRACFVCGKSFETRVAVFTHLKENHSIHNRKCLKCNKTFNNRTELQKHFASAHDIDFVVDLSEQHVRCYICDVLLEDRVALSEHLPQHRKEGFNCNMCDMKYTSGSSLRFHKRTVHWKLEGTRSCKVCDKIFTNMKSYELHMINHFYDFLGPMKCTKCDLTLKNKKLYKQHIASHGMSTICEHCGKVCIDQHALRHHVVTHNLNEKCDICGKKLNKYSLKNHMTKVHGDKEKVACHLCGRLVSPSYMKAHVEEMHNRIKVLKRGKKDCDVCGKVFKRPGLLKQHIVVHTGEKPHICEVCGKAFGHKTALNTHYYTHKGYKPQKCLFCKSSFWLISQCKAHMKVEHDFVDHKLKQACPHCDKRFKHLSGLRLHLDEYHPEKVQGPKLYPCHKCKKEFKYRKSLREHFATCNPAEKVRDLYSNKDHVDTRYNSDSIIPSQQQAEKLRDLYSNKDHVDTCYNSDSIIPSQQQAEMAETFQEIIQNPIEMSELSNHTQIIRVDGSVQSQIETMETEQQIMIQDESGEVTYQTIYIQSDEANGQVYMQDIANQDQLVVQDGTEKEELIVALPEDCGEYNVDFITSSNGIIEDGQIGYAEIVVQYQ